MYKKILKPVAIPVQYNMPLLNKKKTLCLNWVPQLLQSWAVVTEIVWDSELKGEMRCAACDHWTWLGDSTADCSPAA